MDTACSSALTAVHAACEHIWAGRGDTALAGGVTVMITPGGFIGFSQASMLSPEGRVQGVRRRRPTASCAAKARAWCC